MNVVIVVILSFNLGGGFGIEIFMVYVCVSGLVVGVILCILVGMLCD